MFRVLGLYGDNGKENGNYRGYRVKTLKVFGGCKEPNSPCGTASRSCHAHHPVRAVDSLPKAGRHQVVALGGPPHHCSMGTRKMLYDPNFLVP